MTITYLNWVTLLCWLNLVMMDTSMNGFGSGDTRETSSESNTLKKTELLRKLRCIKHPQNAPKG